MKYALIIPDGCADEPQESLGGRTPLEAAETPQMDRIVRQGLIGRAETVPLSMPSGSDVGTMSLFGYDPLKNHTGRAPIEAAAQGLELGPADWAVRCNLVTIQNGRMVSFTAGQVPNDLAAQLIGLMKKEQGEGSPWAFHTGVSYRNLLLYRSQGEPSPLSTETVTHPPHDVTDQEVAQFLPQGPGADVLRRLMLDSEELFRHWPQNLERQQQGELPVTGIWLWGEGKRPSLEPFLDRFGKRAAVITAVDLLRGLGKLLGWQIIEVPGATGYIDTDFEAKGRYAIDVLEDVDFVVIHIEAPDEASHEGEAALKVEALENIDKFILGPVHQHLESLGEYRVLVSPDHPTFLRTKTHAHGAVPFAMCGRGITPDKAQTFDEPAAAHSSLSLDGHDLMPMFLRR